MDQPNRRKGAVPPQIPGTGRRKSLTGPATLIYDENGELARTGDRDAAPAGHFTGVDPNGYLIFEPGAAEGLRTVILGDGNLLVITN